MSHPMEWDLPGSSRNSDKPGPSNRNRGSQRRYRSRSLDSLPTICPCSIRARHCYDLQCCKEQHFEHAASVVTNSNCTSRNIFDRNQITENPVSFRRGNSSQSSTAKVNADGASYNSSHEEVPKTGLKRKIKEEPDEEFPEIIAEVIPTAYDDVWEVNNYPTNDPDPNPWSVRLRNKLSIELDHDYGQISEEAASDKCWQQAEMKCKREKRLSNESIPTLNESSNPNCIQDWVLQTDMMYDSLSVAAFVEVVTSESVPTLNGSSNPNCIQDPVLQTDMTSDISPDIEFVEVLSNEFIPTLNGSLYPNCIQDPVLQTDITYDISADVEFIEVLSNESIPTLNGSLYPNCIQDPVLQTYITYDISADVEFIEDTVVSSECIPTLNGSSNPNCIQDPVLQMDMTSDISADVEFVEDTVVSSECIPTLNGSSNPNYIQDPVLQMDMTSDISTDVEFVEDTVVSSECIPTLNGSSNPNYIQDPVLQMNMTSDISPDVEFVEDTVVSGECIPTLNGSSNPNCIQDPVLQMDITSDISADVEFVEDTVVSSECIPNLNGSSNPNCIQDPVLQMDMTSDISPVVKFVEDTVVSSECIPTLNGSSNPNCIQDPVLQMDITSDISADVEFVEALSDISTSNFKRTSSSNGIENHKKLTDLMCGSSSDVVSITEQLSNKSVPTLNESPNPDCIQDLVLQTGMTYNSSSDVEYTEKEYCSSVSSNLNVHIQHLPPEKCKDKDGTHLVSEIRTEEQKNVSKKSLCKNLPVSYANSSNRQLVVRATPFLPSFALILNKLREEDSECLLFKSGELNLQANICPIETMNLSVIEYKLLLHKYENPWQFIEEVQKVFENVDSKNSRRTKIGKLSAKLLNMFREKINKVMKYLGYCCGDFHTFGPYIIKCQGAENCYIAKNAIYYHLPNEEDQRNQSSFADLFRELATAKTNASIEERQDQRKDGASAGIISEEQVTSNKESHYLCEMCFIKYCRNKEPIELEEEIYFNEVKGKFIMKTNDEKIVERFCDCVSCKRKCHCICMLCTNDSFLCKNCVTYEVINENFSYANSLKETKLSQYLENRINDLLKEKSCDIGKITIRVIASIEKEAVVQEHMERRYVSNGELPNTFPYVCKTVFAFQEIEGVDTAIFSFISQEYGSECPQPNARRVHISYIDSVNFFRPKQYRTMVYQEILLGYLYWIKQRGFENVHVWSCPPNRGSQYIFFCRPANQKIPNAKRLRDWYKVLLNKGINYGIISNYTSLYNYAVENNWTSVSEIPYFEGDYWPSHLETSLERLSKRVKKRPTSEENTYEKVITSVGECVAKRKNNRSRNQAANVLEENNLTANLIAELYTTMKKYQDNFYVVELNSTDISPKTPTTDPDDLIPSIVMQDRESYLAYSRDRCLEFSSLRRAQFSTRILLHNVYHETFSRKRLRSPDFKDSDSEDEERPFRKKHGIIIPLTISSEFRNLLTWVSELKVTEYFAMAKRNGSKISQETTIIDDDDDNEEDEEIQEVESNCSMTQQKLGVLDTRCSRRFFERNGSEFPLLTLEMEEAVDQAWNTGAPNDELCKITSDYLLRKDIGTLSRLNWLNDLIINSYFDLIVERSKQEGYPSIHAYNTFFYSTYKSKGYDSVRRWTRKFNIFSYDLNFVPMHLGMHWCLAVFDHRSRKVCYYDSMDSGEEQCLDLLHEYLCLEYMDKKGQYLDPSKYTREIMKDIPQQMNGSDCGMFALKFAEYISRDAEITFNQGHMQYFRRRMVYELLTSQLL